MLDVPTANPISPPPPAQDDALASVLREYMHVTDRLQQTHTLLQNEIARLRRELASKNRELERRQRLASLGELAAGVAHEVRNPLGAIQLYSGLLRQQCAGAAPAISLLDKIQVGIAAIEGVVQDTLALAPRTCNLAPRPLAPILAQAIEFCTPRFAQHQVTLVQRGAATAAAAQIHAEEAGLQRVFINLLVNAAEASPPGATLELTVSTPAPGHVAIRVADRGCGFAPGVAEKIFDPFYTTKDYGTGLGLAIAHRLVEAHGGRITARNRRGGGAVFEIKLPTADAQPTSDAPPVARPEPSAA